MIVMMVHTCNELVCINSITKQCIAALLDNLSNGTVSDITFQVS